MSILINVRTSLFSIFYWLTNCVIPRGLRLIRRDVFRDLQFDFISFGDLHVSPSFCFIVMYFVTKQQQAVVAT